MVVYEVVAVCTHKALDYATKVMNKIGYDDIAGIEAHVTIGELTVEVELNEKQTREVIDVFMKRKEQLEGIIGMKIKEFRLKRKEG